METLVATDVRGVEVSGWVLGCPPPSVVGYGIRLQSVSICENLRINK